MHTFMQTYAKTKSIANYLSCRNTAGHETGAFLNRNILKSFKMNRKNTLLILLLSLSGALFFNAGAQHWSLTMKNIMLNAPDLEEAGTLAVNPEAKNYRWSVGCETLDRDYADFSKYKDHLGALGVGYARIQSGWAKCEQKKGRYDFAWLDEIVDGICAQNVKPWMCLCYGNPIYGAQKGLGSVIFDDEETMGAWLKYVRAVVQRYKDKVAMWEVWNEPNLHGNSKYPERYANLLSKTVDVIKSVDEDAVIIGFGASRMPLKYIESVMDEMQKQGKADILDYISFHPYYENPDDAMPEILALKSLVETYSDKIKLFQGESGCPSILEWGHALRYNEWSEYSQAKWDMRRIANDFSIDIPSSIFTLVDLQYPNMQQSFGLVRTNLLKEPVYRRPSFYGVRNMCTILTENRKPDGRLEYESNGSRKITAVAIKDESGRRIGAMLWFGDRIPDSSLERTLTDVTLKGLDLKNPVCVDPLTGKAYLLDIKKGGNFGGTLKIYGLPMWDCPIFVMEKDSVQLENAVEARKSGSAQDMHY